MKITKRQLKRIIREAEGSTKKYDDDSALKGGQSNLPDGLQKSIIDKTVEDRDEEDKEEKNESTRITKRQLIRLIKEERRRLLSEDIADHEMYASDPELQELGEAIESLVHWTMETDLLMSRMSERYGELAALTTTTRRVANDVEEIANKFDGALDDMIRFR